MQIKNLFKFQNFIWLAVIIIVSLRPILDPDLGWHLRLGQETIAAGQPPQTDTFSHSQFGYPYVAHSWLQDIILWFSYDTLGMIGVSLWYTFLVLLLAVVWMSFKTDKKQSLYLIIPGLWFTLIFVDLRPHLISLIGFSLVFKYFYSQLYLQGFNSKWSWLLLVFFGIWANMHAGVVVGLGLFLTLLIIKLIIFRDNRQIEVRILGQNLFLWLALALATLFNPYTFRIYLFSLNLASNYWSKTYNLDWLPLLASGHGVETLGWRILLLLWAVAVILYAKSYYQRILVAVLLCLTLISIRYSLVMFAVLGPLSFDLLSPYWQKHLARFSPKIIGLGLLGTVLLVNYSSLSNWMCSVKSSQCYAQLGQYPYHAAQKLAETESNLVLLNHYTWGGYLLWQVPDRKVFIDGRMDSFMVNNQSFLSELVVLEEIQPGWEQKMNQYQINAILFPPWWPIVQQLKTDANWQLVYEDEISVLMIQQPNIN